MRLGCSGGCAAAAWAAAAGGTTIGHGNRQGAAQRLRAQKRVARNRVGNRHGQRLAQALRVGGARQGLFDQHMGQWPNDAGQGGFYLQCHFRRNSFHGRHQARRLKVQIDRRDLGCSMGRTVQHCIDLMVALVLVGTCAQIAEMAGRVVADLRDDVVVGARHHNLIGSGKVHDALRHIDAVAHNIDPVVDIQHHANRPQMQAHAHGQFFTVFLHQQVAHQ